MESDPKARARLVELMMGLPPQRSSALDFLMGLDYRPTAANALGDILGEALRRSRGEPSGALSRLMRPQVKRSLFASYHHGGDRFYYELLSSTFCDQFDVIHDNSPDRRIDSDDPDYVRRRLREDHITGSSCTIVLVGRDTWGRKHVDWEIDATLEKQHGLIGVLLPSAPVSVWNTVQAPERLADNVLSGYALWITWGQLTWNAAVLPNLIEQANARPKYLINNSRARRYRNA